MRQMACVVLVFLGLLAVGAFLNLAVWYFLVETLGLRLQ